MLEIAYKYSVRWRYSYNTEKCKVVHFTNTTRHNRQPIQFGNTRIHCHNVVAHVGTLLNNTLKCNDSIKQRCTKGRSSIFAVLAIENISGNVNPITLSSIMSRVCLPVTLYGCELWHTMNNNDIDSVERIIRLAAKTSQNLPVRMRTDMALSMIGWLPAIAHVDTRKLLFLQRLCTIPTSLLCKLIFNFRLNLYFVKGCTGQLGFIPDICRILVKYRLMPYMTTYLNSATFPSKAQWKSFVKRRVNSFHNSAWLDRTSQDSDFETFSFSTQLHCIQPVCGHLSTHEII